MKKLLLGLALARICTGSYSAELLGWEGERGLHTSSYGLDFLDVARKDGPGTYWMYGGVAHSKRYGKHLVFFAPGDRPEIIWVLRTAAKGKYLYESRLFRDGSWPEGEPTSGRYRSAVFKGRLDCRSKTLDSYQSFWFEDYFARGVLKFGGRTPQRDTPEVIQGPQSFESLANQMCGIIAKHQ